MQRMRAKPEVPVVVGMEEGKDLGRQLARRVPVSNRCLSTLPIIDAQGTLVMSRTQAPLPIIDAQPLTKKGHPSGQRPGR